MGRRAEMIWRLYEVDYEKGVVKFKGRRCPRCGKLMAHHLQPTPRWACGGCGYTEYEKRAR